MSQAGLLHVTDSVLPPDVPLIFQGNSGSGSAVGNVFEILGAGGATTSVVGNVMTITFVSSGFTWNVVTSATNPNQIIIENGYICNGASLVTFLLPLAPAIGDTFKIFSHTARFQIIPNGGQNMVIGAATGISGATGTATSNSPGDEITFTYMGTNTFQSEGPQGTITLVTS